jgi:hypothetical protein
MPAGPDAIKILGKATASAGFLGCLAGLMIHFHITTYPYLEWALAGSLVIYFWSRPSARSWIGTVLLAALFAIVYGMVQGGPLLGGGLAFLGLGSIGSLGLDALWSGRGGSPASLETCLKASIFPLFLIVAGFSLAITSIVHPKTYDLFLYAFDAELGWQPSFVAGRLFGRFGALRQVCYFGYESLPLAMAIAFALERSRPRRQSSGIMLAFTVAAAGGFLLYNLYPAVGPIHVFGAQFPHIAMALLILWNSRRGPRLWRFLAGALLGMTVLATLGFGEHYLADLCVAVPFALLAQALAASGLGWRHRLRVASVATGAVSVLGWLAYLRMPSPPLAARGSLAWCLLWGTAVVAIVLESRLYRAEAGAGVAADERIRGVNEGEYRERLPVSG